MMVLEGGVMVLLLAEDGSGVSGHAALDAVAPWLYHAAQVVLCELISNYNVIGSIAKRGGSGNLSLSPLAVAAT